MGSSSVGVEAECEHVHVVLEETNAIKAGFGHGGAVPMDAKDEGNSCFPAYRGEIEERRKELLKGCVFATRSRQAIPSSLKERVLLGKCVFPRFR